MYLRSSLFWDVTPYGLLVTDFSGQPIGLIVNCEGLKKDLSDCLTLEDGTDRLFRNVGNYQSTLHNIAEERRSHLDSGGGLKSCKVILAGTDEFLHLLSIFVIRFGFIR